MIVLAPFLPLTLAMARMLPLVVLAPFGALSRVPGAARAGLALLLAAAGAPAVGRVPGGAALVLLYASNLLLGALAGAVALFSAWVLPTAGGVLDASYGFSLVQELNPTGSPTSLMTGLFTLLMPTFFLEAGGLAWLVGVLWQSYATWPLTRLLQPSPYWFSGLGQFAAAALDTGFGLALPFVLVALVLSLLSGLVGRLLPQLQVLTLQFPLLMGLGLVMVLVAIPTLPDAVATLLTSAEAALSGLAHAAWGGP